MLNKLLIVLLTSLFFNVTAENQLTIAFGSFFKFYRTHDTDVFKRIQSFNLKYFYGQQIQLILIICLFQIYGVQNRMRQELKRILISPRKQDGIQQSFYADQYNKILIIMIDSRQNSDKFTRDSLGENQWKRLEQQFQTESQLIIMTYRVQIMHEDRDGPETWFGWSKQKLYALFKKYNKPIIFLYGVEMSIILKLQNILIHMDQNLYELTSSEICKL